MASKSSAQAIVALHKIPIPIIAANTLRHILFNTILLFINLK